MASEKVETETDTKTDTKNSKGRLSRLFWHGGSVYDAWFSCASNQVVAGKDYVNVHSH